MEGLLDSQQQLMGGMNNLLKNFKKDSRDRKTPDYLRHLLDKLDSYWNEFNSNHVQLCAFGDKSVSYFTDMEYEKTKDFYSQARQLIQTYQPEGSRPTTPLIKPATPLNFPTTNPALNLPTPGKAEGTTSKLDEMLRKQSSNFKAFSRTVTNIDIDALNAKWEFEDVLETLQSRWSVIDTLHWEIDSELNGDYAMYEQEFSKHEKTYNNLKRTINVKMWSVSHRDKIIPKMEIPNFSGSYQQWTSFKDLFQETIHNNSSLSSAQKLQFLKSKLKGEAEKLIQHLTISSENYQISWDILNHRYNNTKLIVTSHLNTLLNLPVMQSQASASIKRLHDTTHECLNAIQKLGADTSSWDPLLVHLLSQKLDAESHNDYIESLEKPRELPTLKDFLGYLETKFTSLEAFRRKQDATKPSNHETNVKKPFPQNPPNNYYNKNSGKPSYKALNVITQKCPLCSENHPLFFCKSFREYKPESKYKTIVKLNVCRNCLVSHQGKECKSNKTCRHCNEKHNSLLHDALTTSSAATNATNYETNRQNCNVSQENMAEILLATAMLNVQGADGSSHRMRALIDQGSQTSLITENAAQKLGLPRQRCKGVILGVGARENNCKGAINITMSSLHNDFTHTTDVYIMNNLINRLPNHSFEKPVWPYFTNIQLADPDFNKSRSVDMLLGADVYAAIILGGIIKTDSSVPVAQQTQFGWILCGNVKTFQCNVVINDLEDIQQFWEIEDIAQESSLSSCDDQCVEFYKSTTKRDEDGRYNVRLPLKPNFEEKLGTSKPMAVAQFRQLERKFSRNQQIDHDYKQFINEYISLGHMIPAVGNQTPECYLPHHCVQRSDSTTTALRVVFNASARTSSGVSINDQMEAGPNLQQDLLSLITRWRQYRYAFSADIEKMFRQIWINKDDQPLQKIVWRDNPTSPIEDYQLTTVTYGTKAAPFLAMMTLRQLAFDEEQNYPDTNAPEVLKDSFYMDDLLHGSHSLTYGKTLQLDLIRLLKSGGFNLRKWKSNTPELLPDRVSDNQVHFDFKQVESTKTLGLRWDPYQDNFTFISQLDQTISHPTKRNLLSDVSKIFDPSGWLSPVTTKLKLLFQPVWKLNMNWDDNLPEGIQEEWRKVKTDINQIEHLQIPRWIGTKENDTIELHGFCDASTKAYACVIYCKINQGQESSVILVVAKARLVPTSKSITLPRLELCGAQLLARLMTKVKNCLPNYHIQVHGWIDSMAVLGWIQGDPSRWKTFVSNRVRQIVEAMPSSCWSYVKSEQNPADCASRGLTAVQLRQHPLWWKGPHWLPNYKPDLDNNQSAFYTDLEAKKVNNTNVVIQSSDGSIIQQLIAKHSTFTRVIRILAWILRTFPRNKYQQPYLNLAELNKAKLMIIRDCQQLEFSEEITKLKDGQSISKKSKIFNLNPFLDEEDLLRVGGRLENAHVDRNMKHSFIIPHCSKLTDLLIDHGHKLTYHGGPRLTLAFLRKSYWIVGGNRATKKRLRLCVKCRRTKPDRQQQLMGDLPEARSNLCRPFQHTGVDFTGSILIKANKGRGIKTTKGYISVFVCMATKAVHLELVSDLSTSSFLAALRRMAARRGAPQHIYSDNGTNFVGASRVLYQELEFLKKTGDSEFMTEISEMGIEWHFNAPSWPTAGGLWEAAVKSLKHHLRRVIGEQKLTFEEFTTILTQLEACLNSRPLCALTEDPEDLDYLTPSHFLASGPILTIVETEYDERTRWQLTQKIFRDVWNRWKAEYLTQLSARTKWREPKHNMKIDDVVIIQDDNLPAGKWALGRVIELHPGQDGYVRVVTLKTKNNIMKRPIVKLSVLPVNSNATDDDSCNQKSLPTRKGLIKHSFNIIALTLMLLMFVLAPVQGTYTISNLPNNQTIYFDQLSTMSLARDEWKLIVYYDMNPYWQGNELFRKYYKYLEKICTDVEVKLHCDVILLQLQRGYNECEYYNKMLMSQEFIPHARRRRGLINGVGYIAHSLFGILDEDFAEQYGKEINLIKTNQNQLAKLWKNQTSIIEAEYNLLKRVGQTMDKEHKIFHQHLMSLERASTDVKIQVQRFVTMTDFAMSSIVANGVLTSLRYIQDTLLDTITNIYYGNFNIHLLKPEQLLQELNKISGYLDTDLSLPIDNIQENLSKIYNLLKVKARVTSQYLLFEIKIPLVSRDLYDLYKLIPIPRKNDNRWVTLVPISTHIAINLKKDLYWPLTINELQSCIHMDNTTQLCSLHSPLYQYDTDQSLCTKDQTTKACKTSIAACKQTWTQLSTVNTYLYSCCGQCSVRIICGRSITAETLTGAGIIELKEYCLIKGDTFTITAHKSFTSNVNIRSDTMTPLIPPINHVINISIPTAQYGNNEATNTSNIFNDDLKEIGDQIRQMKSQEGIIEGISNHDVHHYAAIYVLMCAAAAVGLAWLWRHERSRRATAAALRSDFVKNTSDNVRCVSVSQSHNDIAHSSDMAKVVYVSVDDDNAKYSARIDKATSPCIRNQFKNTLAMPMDS